MRMRLLSGARAHLQTLAELARNGLSTAAADLDRGLDGFEDLARYGDTGEELRDLLVLLAMMRRDMTLIEIRSSLHMLEAQRTRPARDTSPPDDSEPPPGASGLLEELPTKREKFTPPEKKP